MNDKTIYAFIDLKDFDFNKLPSSARNLSGKKLEDAIRDDFRDRYKNLPGNIDVKLDGDLLVVSYEPYELSDEDERKFRTAINLLTERKIEEGRALLEELIEDYPLDPFILYNLGMSFSEQGDFERSLKPLEKAVEILPYYSQALTALGVSYNGLKNTEKALEYTVLAVKYGKENFYATRNLASLYATNKDFLKAEEYINKAIDIEPDEPSGLITAAMIYKELGKNNDAKKLLKKIIENGIDDKYIKQAQELITKLTSDDFKKDTIRMDAVMYLVSAIKEFEEMPIEKIRDITFNIGLQGQYGFSIGDAEVKYRIEALDKTCTGLQMVCYMYAGFKIIEPGLDIGFDFSKEYEVAKGMV